MPLSEESVSACMQVSPPILSAAIFSVLSAFGVEWLSKRSDMREDSAIAKRQKAYPPSAVPYYLNLSLINIKLYEPCYFPLSSPSAANLKQI